ncbi:MAG: RNA polymerase factor sigma-54 [Desulfobacula sp.]|jgi:RNA polymerase sigma-54 factor|uniref:RNA polymerase factor sigma-54 n=1 Tax=Desulfobacula sp. TaxID=2593537 RepID=UPI001E109730|nr:RNA polymerase factor sigma-54 [Desulfobacula sp.]MBT3485867.1 RNA polymerase factor sigma-54 [Desulfobacula sp.]MBT3805470.1 RNA polymerase factor sigma-54 [Desulfobacula sp.]MBT4026815.1 RNA polymerase factor sigma-54 [Desulfobacula sp.]MBT4199581.1 RNA polymerase factor sigma-54 [Desulfobacula sp.]
MELGLQQSLILTQQLVMTPQLQQAIKLLQLSRLELAEMIQQEMEQNPALEESGIDEPSDKNITALENKPDPSEEETRIKEITIEEKIRPDTNWENYINEYNSTGRVYTESENTETPNYEAFTSEKKTLKDHLQWQLGLSGLNETQEKIGIMMIGNLNRDGYLCSEVEEIAQACDVDIDLVEDVLSILQTFDPPGVCARNLCETLLIQVQLLGIDNPIITEIIKNHLKNLENRNSKKIAKALKISTDDVRAAVNIIQYLEPKPGRKFSADEPAYITPDIYVYKEGNGFKIVMNDDGLPKLKINRFYKDAIANGRKISRDTKNYLNEKMQSASWLIKSIHQRQKTIYLVMESILKFQKQFFEHGIAHLRPLILKDIAEDIEMHESTISRVTTNKYAYTPQGLFELKYFFNSSIERIGGESMASESVKDKIRMLIENEDHENPLSDEKLSNILRDVNIQIARRTVAKYRKVLNILPSNKRKQL